MIWSCGEEARGENIQLSYIFCIGSQSMAKGPEADLARTGCLVSLRMQLLSLFITGVDEITIDAAEQQATDRVHWRGLIRRNKEFICGAGHSND